MGKTQPLKGNPNKIYEVINNFSKGYNTATADDLLNDNVFREISNFIPGKEGNLTKRPGINKVGLYDFFKDLKDNNYSDKIDVIIRGMSNNPKDGSPSDINTLFNYVFAMFDNSWSNYNYGEFSSTTTFTPSVVSNITIIDNNELLDNMFAYKSILNLDNKSLFEEAVSFDLLLIFSGDTIISYYGDTRPPTKGVKGLRIIKLKTQLNYNPNSTTPYQIIIDFEMRTPMENELTYRQEYSYDGDDIIELTVYNGKYYFMNGIDAIIQIDSVINGLSELTDMSINEIHHKSSIYKPTAIEVSNIGFNILSNDPLSFITIEGSADAVKGVFYTLDGEPTQKIPFNKPFRIHIIASGTGTIAKPQYRPDNGEIDATKNPYKDFPGKFNATNKGVFDCTGLDVDGNFEIKLKKGEVEFINYFTTGAVETKNIGRVSDISELVLSSRYCKVINNQLVLYGNHGYIFFSEFDNFRYFPNYFNLYAAETNNEVVVSINYFRQYYAIFTNKRIKRMTGSFGSEDFGVFPLNDFVGCVNSHSIKQVENMLYFLSDNGLHMLKQGYVGEGTENVQQIDMPIYGSYNVDNIAKSINIQNYYIMCGKKEAIFNYDSILYNYVLDAFYKMTTPNLINMGADDFVLEKEDVSVPFQFSREPSCLYYGIMEHDYRVPDVNTMHKFDLMLQNFNEQSAITSDNYNTFISTIETPFLSMGYPTNIKKFKQIYLKIYNNYGNEIPLYVTIKVDDKVVLTPEDYIIKHDEENNIYYYVKGTDPNVVIKGTDPNVVINGYNLIGTLELGKDILGNRTIQILKLKVGDKGRGIKIIISDGLKNEEVNGNFQNYNNFEISTVGIVYKVKKVKEG